MRYVFLVFLFVINTVAAQDSTSQNFALEERFLNLGSWEGWKFHPDDNIEWASPDFDDGDWMYLNPTGFKNPLPDSIWSGYGWFRLTFQADTNMYHKVLNLYFFTRGAAEVYLDGKLFSSYGNFSSDATKEVRFMPDGKFHLPVVLAPQEKHVIAIRFSYHKGPLYKRLIGKYAGYFGFVIGFRNKESNQYLHSIRDNFLRTFYIASSMMLVIFVLQAFLLYLLPHERSNYYVTIIIFILLLHNACAFSLWYLELDALGIFIIQNVPFILFGALAFSFFPIGLSTMFNQKPKLIYKILIYGAPLLTFISFGYNFDRFRLIGVFGLLIFVLSLNIFYRAIKERKKGVWFVAFGFLGSILGSMASTLLPGFIQISLPFLTIFITMAYVSIPLGMTLFMAYRFYLLNAGLENKVMERTHALKQSLEHLQSTQAQLIQSEKMASLGELTAGIAHEIQNPLNFVNNFSEVNKELAIELEEEIDKGNYSDAKVLAKDIIDNEEKINHHGKRADAIIKGMLQHSRTSSGQKEPTDINALCDEYLRLAYHGLKAKDQSFNATFHFEPDNNLPIVNVIPQDIGRVLLNLINNAFQAVSEKVKSEMANVKGDSSSVSTFTLYNKAMVTVSTKNLGDTIQISVMDNGPGIPDAIRDKIFQPFFTTKPTGQGTGLGLSLSYDIVKAHGGELKVETKEGEGSEFMMVLPQD